MQQLYRNQPIHHYQRMEKSDVKYRFVIDEQPKNNDWIPYESNLESGTKKLPEKQCFFQAASHFEKPLFHTQINKINHTTNCQQPLIFKL